MEISLPDSRGWSGPAQQVSPGEQLQQLHSRLSRRAGREGTGFATISGMLSKRLVGRITRIVVLALLAIAPAACEDANYRTEVYPTAEGHVEVQRVPRDKPLITRSAAPPVEARPIDPQLAEFEAVWPKLSPEDRTTVIDLAKRLANSTR